VAVANDVFDLSWYRIRRKVLKIFGASFHVYDEQHNVVAFSSQKAFKLREDIRVYADESKQTELLQIHARQIVDFSAAYDLIDSRDGAKVGALRRKGFTSIMRDTWELLDAEDRPTASLKEDSMGLAMVRRFLTNLVPQRFHLETPSGEHVAEFLQRFNPFIYKLDVVIPSSSPLDRRVVFGAAVLIAAIEGRQG